MNCFVGWLKITWPILLIGTVIGLAGLALVFSGNPGLSVLGVVIVVFAAYWTHKGATPEPDPKD